MALHCGAVMRAAVRERPGNSLWPLNGISPRHPALHAVVDRLVCAATGLVGCYLSPNSTTKPPGPQSTRQSSITVWIVEEPITYCSLTHPATGSTDSDKEDGTPGQV